MHNNLLYYNMKMYLRTFRPVKVHRRRRYYIIISY